MDAAIQFLDTQSFAHILLSKLEAVGVWYHLIYDAYRLLTPLIKSPIPQYFNPKRELKAKGPGWAIASSPTSEAGSQDENKLLTGTVLHFAHPKLIQIAIEMIMVFPQSIMKSMLDNEAGVRSDNIVVSPAILVRWRISFRRSTP